MRREWVATLDADGQEIAVSVSAAGDEMSLEFTNAQHTVDAQRISATRWSLLIDGRSHLVDVLRADGRVTVVSAAGVTTMVLEDARQKELAKTVAGAAGSEQGEILVAPIAGKVVKIFFEVGATVVAGDPVVVLEAMKMENEIKASRDGTVTKIHVESGASVETRAKLVTLESLAPD